jgi:hypothetical protein
MLRALEPEAATRGIKVAAEISPAPLLDDARLIERLISNLMPNPLLYNMQAASCRRPPRLRKARPPSG